MTDITQRNRVSANNELGYKIDQRRGTGVEMMRSHLLRAYLKMLRIRPRSCQTLCQKWQRLFPASRFPLANSLLTSLQSTSEFLLKGENNSFDLWLFWQPRQIASLDWGFNFFAHSTTMTTMPSLVRFPPRLAASFPSGPHYLATGIPLRGQT